MVDLLWKVSASCMEIALAFVPIGLLAFAVSVVLGCVALLCGGR